MKVKVIDFLDNYAICYYIDEEGHNAYGYFHFSDIDFIRLPVEKKVSIGSELDTELMYVSKRDNVLRVPSTFEEWLNGLERFNLVEVYIIKETKDGSIVNVNDIPGHITGNYNIATRLLASVGKILREKNMFLLNDETVR